MLPLFLNTFYFVPEDFSGEQLVVTVVNSEASLVPADLDKEIL